MACQDTTAAEEVLAREGCAGQAVKIVVASMSAALLLLLLFPLSPPSLNRNRSFAVVSSMMVMILPPNLYSFAACLPINPQENKKKFQKMRVAHNQSSDLWLGCPIIR